MTREGNIQVHSENILPIIKKWLYSDKDIFLRELISNCCDAIKKFEKLVTIGETKSDADDSKPRINVYVNKEDRTLVFEDNGIGMTEEEVEKYITQVAFSGAQEFIDRYKDKGDGSEGIIGHFGLGFYSAFMVSDSVEIETLSYIEGAKPVHWRSIGESAYEIGDGERGARGTTVTLHIAENESEFLDENRVRDIFRKYCAFMPYEIYLNPKAASEVKESGDTDGDSENKADSENEEQKPVNTTSPLWLKAPKDCTDEEYRSFYSQLFMDFNPPLFWIHLNVDYPFNLKGILYFPKMNNELEVVPGEIKLYSNQVYIADNIKEVVPEFLMLLKGVIDCPDLPLNVSRSFLQNDGDVQKISKHISKKVSDKLHSIFNEERDNYNSYWDSISPFIKFGCVRDEDFYDRVKDIVLLKTIKGEYVPLNEYQKDADGKIFYVSDENLQAQYVRMFNEQGINAAVLTHVIDTHFISFIEYKEQGIKFARIDSEIGSTLKSGETDGDSHQITDKFKQFISNGDVTVTAEKLKNADLPAVMLLSESSRRMQDMSKLYGDMFGAGAKPEISVVLNLENDIVKAIPSLPEDQAKLVCQHIFDLAQLSHKPLSADEMAGFISRSVKILGIAAVQK